MLFLGPPNQFHSYTGHTHNDYQLYVTPKCKAGYLDHRSHRDKKIYLNIWYIVYE